MALQSALVLVLLTCQLCSGKLLQIEQPADHTKFQAISRELFTRQTAQDRDELEDYLAESVQEAVGRIGEQSQREILVHMVRRAARGWGWSLLMQCVGLAGCELLTKLHLL